METDKLSGKVVYLDEDFGISYDEPSLGVPHCHFRANNWSPSIARRAKDTVDKLMLEERRDVICLADINDRKLHKFLSTMKFEHFKNKWVLVKGEEAVISIYIRRY